MAFLKNNIKFIILALFTIISLISMNFYYNNKINTYIASMDKKFDDYKLEVANNESKKINDETDDEIDKEVVEENNYRDNEKIMDNSINNFSKIINSPINNYYINNYSNDERKTIYNVTNNVVTNNTNLNPCKHEYVILDSKQSTCSIKGCITYKCIKCYNEVQFEVGLNENHKNIDYFNNVLYCKDCKNIIGKNNILIYYKNIPVTYSDNFEVLTDKNICYQGDYIGVTTSIPKNQKIKEVLGNIFVENSDGTQNAASFRYYFSDSQIYSNCTALLMSATGKAKIHINITQIGYEIENTSIGSAITYGTCNYKPADINIYKEIDVLDINEAIKHEHKHEFEVIRNSPSSCIEKGYNIYQCTKCGYTKKVDLELDYNNHKFASNIATLYSSPLNIQTGKCFSCNRKMADISEPNRTELLNLKYEKNVYQDNKYGIKINMPNGIIQASGKIEVTYKDGTKDMGTYFYSIDDYHVETAPGLIYSNDFVFEAKSIGVAKIILKDFFAIDSKNNYVINNGYIEGEFEVLTKDCASIISIDAPSNVKIDNDFNIDFNISDNISNCTAQVIVDYGNNELDIKELNYNKDNNPNKTLTFHAKKLSIVKIRVENIEAEDINKNLIVYKGKIYKEINICDKNSNASVADLFIQSNIVVGNSFKVALNLPTNAYSAQATITIRYNDGRTQTGNIVYMSGMLDFPNSIYFTALNSGIVNISASNIIISDSNSNSIEKGGFISKNFVINDNSVTAPNNTVMSNRVNSNTVVNTSPNNNATSTPNTNTNANVNTSIKPYTNFVSEIDNKTNVTTSRVNNASYNANITQEYINVSSTQDTNNNKTINTSNNIIKDANIYNNSNTDSKVNNENEKASVVSIVNTDTTALDNFIQE